MGTLTITDNSSTGSTQTVSLSGTGTAPAGPAVPTGVSIQRTSATAATLAWTDASNNETSFQVQTSTNAGSTWANLGTAITRNATQRTSTGGAVTSNIAVTNTTNALYRVQVINATGSGVSASVSLNDTVAPVAPTGLTGSRATTRILGIAISSTVTTNWTDAANNRFDRQYDVHFRVFANNTGNTGVDRATLCGQCQCHDIGASRANRSGCREWFTRCSHHRRLDLDRLAKRSAITVRYPTAWIAAIPWSTIRLRYPDQRSGMPGRSICGSIAT